MPIPLPNLDNRTFADLAAELRALIPRDAPAWTDHNLSDPGIMLIELFAWLTEATLYRLNRIPEASERRFLALLGVNTPDLPAARAQAIANLTARWRAITAEDFEQLVIDQPDFKVARARCLPELDLSASDPLTPRPGHVSLIVVPRTDEAEPRPTAELLDRAGRLLAERRLITCQSHAVGPAFTRIRLDARVVRVPQAIDRELIAQIKAQLCNFFQPLTGGPDKTGWPFGRDVYAAEMYQLIEAQPGVDHV